MRRAADVIALRGLAADAIHGVLPEERLVTQPFVVDVLMRVDASQAARTDSIDDTVSYAEIADEVAAILTGPSVRLLETLGQRIADAVLAHERVLGVEVTVHKPKAPIDQAFSDVSVTVRRGDFSVADAIAPRSDPAARARTDRSSSPRPSRVVLALGGNIGDAPSTLARAVESLVDSRGVDVLDVSPILRTAPVLAPGQEPQADYWNAVVLLETRLDPGGVLALARSLEAEARRVRVEHWGPRTLDVDVIDYAGIRLAAPDLLLPHPRAASRAFVLVPWLMVDPSATLGGRPVAELLDAAPDREGILDAVDEWLLDPASVLAESDAFLAAAIDEGGAPAPLEADRGGAEPGGSLQAPPVGSAARAVQEAAPEPTPEHPSADSSSPGSEHGTGPVEEASYGPARLDLVPEASRIGLAPTDSGEDLVWRRLWERWSRPEPIGSPNFRAFRAPVESPSLTHVPVAPEPVVLPASPDEGCGLLDAVAEVEDEPPEIEAAAAPHAAPGALSRDSGAPALEEGADSEERAPEDGPAELGKKVRWLPIFGRGAVASKGGDEETHDPAPDAPSSAAESAARIERAARRLPSWDFGRADVRIVDEPGAVADVPGAVEESPAPAARVPVRRSIVDPGLPEGALRGPLPDTELTRTGLLRAVVVRPSTTGQIPIVKDRDRE